MKCFKRFLDFYIDLSIHVALAVVALTYICLTKLDLPVDYTLLFFNFFSTILGYNFVKYAALFFQKKPEASFKLKMILVVTIISFFASIYFVLHFNFKTILVLGVSFLLTIFYSISNNLTLVYSNLNTGLRQVPGLKIFIIALVWAIVTNLVPALKWDVTFTSTVYLNTLQVFLLVVVLMIPFEIRDLIYDDLKLKTLPQMLGVFKTKVLGVALCLVIFFLELLKKETTTKQVYLLLVVLCILVLALIFSKKSQHNYYSSFFVEAIPIIWLLVIILL